MTKKTLIPQRVQGFFRVSQFQTTEALGMRTELWELLRQKDPALYRRCRYRVTNLGTNIPGYQGRKLSVKLYRLVRKIYKFN